MSEPRLDALPVEVIALIAGYSNARTTISLGRTCQRIATTCNQSIVFKEVLHNSRARNWPGSQLNIDAIAARCGKDVSAWARYAVADQTAAEWSQNEHPFTSWDHLQSWVPQLLLTDHPFASQVCWREALPATSADLSANEVFCFAQAVISGEATKSEFDKQWDLDLEEKDPNLDHDNSLSSLYWEFCRMVLKFNRLLRNKVMSWPSTEDGTVPYLRLPTMYELRVSETINSQYSLPLPYDGGHKQWYANHTRAMVEDSEYFTTGTWQGYYSYSDFFMSSHMLDPPMRNIKFRRVGTSPETIELCGEGGSDGAVGPFSVDLLASQSAEGIAVRGSKVYLSGSAHWEWDLKVTPLGLIGYWGRFLGPSFSRKGFVWLWKAGGGEVDGK